MRTLTKKTVKRLKNGSYGTLVEVFEEMVDTYNEDKFDNGYKSCLFDLSVRSYRLAGHILKHTTFGGKKPKFTETAQDDLAKVIEDYFNKALNGK